MQIKLGLYLISYYRAMANGIGRIRTIGIAAQPTFGVAAPTATFVLPVTNAPQFSTQVQKALNEAALGSAYMVNDIQNTVRLTEVPLEFKIDERHYPLLLKQRFTISSGTVSGETAAYTHTLSYSNNTNNWYTIFLQDDDRNDYIVKDALFDNLDHTFDNDYVRVSASVIGAYPTASAVTNAITQPNEFVGRMVSYQDADVPGTATASAVLTLAANLDFGLNSDETRFGLGSAELACLQLTADKYMLNVTRLKPDTGYYDDNEAGTTKQVTLTVQDTGRFVSPTSTNPSITITVPRAKMETYTEEPDLDDLIRESFELTMLKPAGVSNTPMRVVVVNSVASY